MTDASPDRVVESPPPVRMGRPNLWVDRLAEARKAAPKWAVWDFDSKTAPTTSARNAAKKAPGGADAYEIVGRTLDGGSSVFIRYRKQVRSVAG